MRDDRRASVGEENRGETGDAWQTGLSDIFVPQDDAKTAARREIWQKCIMQVSNSRPALIKSPCLLQQLSLLQSPILIREAFRILAGPADTSAPLVVLRVGEPPLAAGGLASSQERANGIEGCAIIINCRCIVLLQRS